MMLLPTFVPSFLSGQGHIRLTYFGQWSEVEPQCSQEAVDRLYSAPGKMGVGGDSWISGALVWVKDRGRAGATRMPTERTCVLVLTEVGGIAELTEACDWWSYGSLLYELLTGTVSSWAGYRALGGGVVVVSWIID